MTWLKPLLRDYADAFYAESSQFLGSGTDQFLLTPRFNEGQPPGLPFLNCFNSFNSRSAGEETVKNGWKS